LTRGERAFWRASWLVWISAASLAAAVFMNI
jgi:hypothetical protein